MGEQSQIQFVEWNHNANFIACGGANGTLKVVRHGYDPTDNKLLAGNTLTVNQSLEGHQKMVLHASWNENYQKLTTSDVGGMITVWGGTNEQWHEEMINNRDKSSVVGLEWSPDGQLIAITYADGLVIVGTHDGNRVWSREMEVDLVTCAFSPFDQMIFGTTDGKVFAVDKEGNHVLDLYLPCLETVDLEQALARSRDHREEIVFMSYWSPVPKSKVRMEQEANLRAREAEKKSHAEPVKGTSIFHNYPKRQMREIPEMEKAGEPNQPVPADRPRFVVAYSRGVFQLMRNISDTDSIVIRLKLKITGGKWSPNGAFLAICGTDLEKGGSKVSIVYLLSAYGQTHGIYRHPDASFTGISWDSSGFRMAISSESNLLIATVRPEFKWGCIENTIIYVFQREEMFLYALMYYDYKTEERKEMGLRYFENIAFYKSHCVVVKRHEESTFTCELHNCIGTSLGFTLTAIRPKYVCVNETCAVVANESHYFIWHFVLPKLSAPVMNDEAQSAEYSLEEQQRTVEYGTRRLISSRDQICAICIGDTFFFIALRNGGIYRVNLADGVITNKFPVTPLVESMKLNCDNTRLAVVKLDQNQVPSSLTIYDLMGEVLQQKYTCDKKEIWGYTWDEHDPNMLAFKNKQTIVIYDGAGLVDQQNVSGEICSFNNLAVRTVNMNSILLSPTNPPKSAVQEMMIKAKYDLNSMLKASKLKEAIEYTEKNPHAELWKMIANWAVMNQKFDSAEHVFVKLQDYAGIQFVRQIQNITHRELQHAEILAFTEQLDEAKESFVACDRKDLAIEMYKKISEYEPIYKLIKDDKDENVKAEVLREIAEGHYENLDWEEAMKYYQQCGDTEMQIDCMIKAEKFGNLEELSRILPPDSVHLDVENLDEILKSSLVLSPGKRLRLQSPSEGNTSSRCLSDEETIEANKRDDRGRSTLQGYSRSG
uniref:WD_REPEATS_REGION domain-containing protein n=1 Tax=Caenorhabditis tropicalis TaxID=1561998 RepID=A0A1I7V1E8_9PELO